MLLLGVDFETSGLDPVKDLVIEVGAVIWCTEARAPKLIYNDLVMWPTFTGLSTEIIELTGITPDDVADYGQPADHVFKRLNDLIKTVNYVVAHNGTSFDRPVYLESIKRLGFDEPAKPWLDTMLDVNYPERIKARNLPHLGADHGFLNPFAHRAVFDVLSMLKVLDHYDINSVIALNAQPMVILQAICKAPWEDNGASTGTAKKHGFRWDGEKKRWIKSVKQELAERFLKLENLQVRIVPA